MSLNKAQLRQALGAALEPLGFEPDPSTIAAVGFQGTVEGRVLRVQGALRYRHLFSGVNNSSTRVATGLVFSVMMDTDIATRLSVGPAPMGWLARKVYLPRVGMKPVPAPGGLKAWASETDWAERFMSCDPFRVLASESSDLSVTALTFSPESISLTCFQRIEQFDDGTVRRWLELMTGVAAAAEADPPQRRAAKTWLERQPKRTRIFILIALLFGVPMLLLGLFGLFLIVVLVILTTLF